MITPQAGAEMLPCPFCGSNNIDPEGWMSCEPDGSDKKTGPACDDCAGSTESVERWNTRLATPIAGRDEIARLLDKHTHVPSQARTEILEDLVALNVGGRAATEIQSSDGGTDGRATGAIGQRGLTDVDLKCQPDRQEGETTLPAGIKPGPSEALPQSGDVRETLPSGIYYSVEHDNFYDAATHAGRGNAFHAKWKDRLFEFPLTAEAALSLPAQKEDGTFQQRVKPWMLACFGLEISADVTERNHRFLEEALELVQACGCTQDEAHQLVDYVYGRDQGDINQEVGGVMVTLAAHCLATGVDMHVAAETELARIWTKVEQIRAKQAAKPKHSPLPQHVATPDTAPDGVLDSGDSV